MSGVASRTDALHCTALCSLRFVCVCLASVDLTSAKNATAHDEARTRMAEVLADLRDRGLLRAPECRRVSELATLGSDMPFRVEDIFRGVQLSGFGANGIQIDITRGVTSTWRQDEPLGCNAVSATL